MPQIPFADNFLASSLLTILMPLGLLIALLLWYIWAARRVPETPESSPSLPPAEVVAAAPSPAVTPVAASPQDTSTAAPSPSPRSGPDTSTAAPSRSDTPPPEPPTQTPDSSPPVTDTSSPVTDETQTGPGPADS